MIIFIAFLPLNLFANTDSGITAITIPSADITLSFLQSGRIDQIHVKEGDKVETHTILVQQYDAAEAAYLAQKRVDLKRLESAQKRGAATDLEVEHAKLEVQIAEIRVDNMKLKSPIDGFVEKLEVEVGESIQALVDVIRIVKIDPLWVDVYVPQDKARDLKVDDNALVNFSEPDKTTLTGKIIFVSRAADAASDTRRVRIEMPNTTGRPSGEHVLVSFNGIGEIKNENKK
jgi:multidrug efflux system membrane fusion protein